jgi:hypothetical protein
VLAAGTSDLEVAEEAAVTLELAGLDVTRLYDVGEWPRSWTKESELKKKQHIHYIWCGGECKEYTLPVLSFLEHLSLLH